MTPVTLSIYLGDFEWDSPVLSVTFPRLFPFVFLRMKNET